MGKRAKSSRKGKKAWRANISTEDIDEYFEKSTKDNLSGGSLSSVPSESLFYVDKSRDFSVKRKIEKHREKVLRVDSVLQRNPFVKPVPSSTLKKSKKFKKALKEVKTTKHDAQEQEAPKDTSVLESGLVDIWDNNGVDNSKTRKISKPSEIPAVEVEPPGCSYNPSFESHQDSLAHAVADEMQKVYKDELGPEPVPLTVPGEVVDEEEMYFLEADDGDDDVEEENLDQDGDAEVEKRPSKTKRVTRVELNRRARRNEMLKAEAEAKKLKELSKEIDSVPKILQEIAKEEKEKERRRMRRLVAKQERLKTAPPRLGKYKFEPAPAQVLLSEEITGSLRKLKYLCRRKPGNLQSHKFSSLNGGRDELSLEEDAERKIGLMLKLLFAGTATIVAYQFFPYMGDNLMQQSVSLLQVKDPLFKRMGASRLARFAIDDERRMKIVEMGGAQELVNMLGDAKDEKTRKEALKALAALAPSDNAVGALHHAGAVPIVKSTPDSFEDAEFLKYKSTLLKRFQELRYDTT
ncbi:Ribosome biogenesis protein Nop53/GLTSCR2 [Dillenia turbinata]|uniref:Ribosome biogenesis protein NOP53 n=1 Tax=Dillenia turbinata TaxID=194707 RepID=A0AAN8ZCA9_9MAGN